MRTRGFWIGGGVATLAYAAVCLMVGPAAVAHPESASEEGAGSQAGPALEERHARWLEEVDLLLTDSEREVFLEIREDYRRDEFIRRFWRVRDPFPQTTRNEYQERYEQRVAAARDAYEGNLTGDRAHMMLTFGVPSERTPFLCSELLVPLEVWEYREGSDFVRGYFTLIFLGIDLKGRRSQVRDEQWTPELGLTRLLSVGRSFGGSDQAIAREIARSCTRGDDLLSALAQTLDLARVESQTSLVPRPSDEWVRTFQTRSTAVGDDAEWLAGSHAISFPGRHQSRTVVQSLVAVERAGLELAELGEHRSYRLLVDGEVLRKGELFDQFRYQFAYPDTLDGEQVPVVVQRYLRPGTYELILKVQDAVSRRVFRVEERLEVPRVDPNALPAPTAAVAATDVAASNPPAPVITEPARKPPRTLYARQLEEANASISTGDNTIRILALPDVLTIGKIRVEARVRGDEIVKVAFLLNDRPVMRKSRPPFSVELDLGDKPRFHKLRVEALDGEGRPLASDEVVINSGPHRFSVRLIEPQSGKLYQSSVRAHAEVEVPEGEKLEKLELFLNEDLVATLYQPPFEQPILLDGSAELAYVRAIASLEGGNTTEDVQFINAPDFVDQLKIQFVELYTTVTGRRGEFVEDLTTADFTVSEDGVPQEVRRFERMRDLPIRAGLVIDTSLSMLTSLHEVKEAAYRFFERVLTPRDRAALVTFSDEPKLAVRFTSDKEVLAGGLAGLEAEGETALYDSIIFSLHYFSGLKGKRAIIVLTDGEDSTSHYSYEDVIEFARRTGVAVYVIGLDLASKQSDVRLRMRQLAAETGGELFLIDNAGQLGKVYEDIERELRSQYLIAYQSSAGGGRDEAFRKVEIEVHRRGLEAKTIRGYYP